MIASNLRALRAGIMPSQSCLINVHLASNSAHNAFAISISKPVILPSSSVLLKGGYAPSTPTRISFHSFACAALNENANNAMSILSFFMVFPYFMIDNWLIKL